MGKQLMIGIFVKEIKKESAINKTLAKLSQSSIFLDKVAVTNVRTLEKF